MHTYKHILSITYVKYERKSQGTEVQYMTKFIKSTDKNRWLFRRLESVLVDPVASGVQNVVTRQKPLVQPGLPWPRRVRLTVTSLAAEWRFLLCCASLTYLDRVSRAGSRALTPLTPTSVPHSLTICLLPRPLALLCRQTPTSDHDYPPTEASKTLLLWFVLHLLYNALYSPSTYLPRLYDIRYYLLDYFTPRLSTTCN